MTKKEDSLKKRFFFKLSTNLVGFILNVLTAGIIPRGLGPVAYGNFSFLTDFFQKIFGFFDSGTSIAFYTKLSQRQNESGIIRFYGKFIILIILIISLLTFTISFKYAEKLWPDQELKFIWMALFWGVLTWLTLILSRIVDAYALTSKGEIIMIFQKILAASILLLMFWFKRFSLIEFFIYHFIILLVLIISWSILIIKNNYSLLPKEKLTKKENRNYIKEFYNYSYPLVFYAFVALIVGILDRLLLQKFGGSTQQAYFGLSQKISTICILFTSSMTPIILREFSIAFKNNNIDLMKKLFMKYIPSLYLISAYFALLMFFQSDNISLIIGGKRFTESSIVIAIMAFYPIHQSYGQLSGSVYYATGKTKLYRNIGIITNCIGLVVLYFFLAPEEKGLNMGAKGLALKMILLQFIGVNIMLWYNCKFLKLSFLKIFSHQFYIVIIFGTFAYITTQISKAFVEKYLSTMGDANLGTSLLSFILCGVLYSMLIILLLYTFPQISFHNRTSLKQQYNHFKSAIFKKVKIYSKKTKK